MEKRIVSILAFVFVVGASFYLGFSVNGGTETPDENAAFNEVFLELTENHYSQPNEEDLWQGAIDGIIESLNDPHTSYFDYEEYSQYQSNFGESYVGIGVTVTFTNDLVVVEEVKSNGPADGAGILPNDIIAYVDGNSVEGDDFYAIISTIIGDVGTQVTIGIVRQGIDDVIYLTMTRSVIDNSSVTYKTFEDGGKLIGYIEVTTFGDETAGKFAEAIALLETLEIDGLVVDLRNNGGGHLGTVVAMLREFLIDNGQEMFSTEFYQNGTFYRQEYDATSTSKKTYDIITLVNGNSASASEVFSSAMQEQGDYLVYGTQTYGKGTMQTDVEIEATESDSIHITIGKWITSDGNWVHYDGGTDGVTPDFVVEPSTIELAYKLFLFDEEILEFDTVDDRTANLQLILNAMGYEVRTDGYFDQETKDAIMDIQLDNSLPRNGDVDSQTLEVINAALDLYQDDSANDTQLQAAISYLVLDPIND